MIQFPEKNYSAKEIANMSGDCLVVRSIFYTIQGEGPFAGRPATFIRLAGCNRGKKIDCPYCDTDFLVFKSKSMTNDEILNEVEEECKGRSRLIVITGGEPLMHNNLPSLVDFLVSMRFEVQIETNGDFVRKDTIPRAVIVVSPKLSGKTGVYPTPNKEMLQRADFLKVVVSGDEENPYHALPFYLKAFAEDKGNDAVFISPINEYLRPVKEGEIASMWNDMYDKEQCGKNHIYAAQVATEFGYRLSLQMHTYVAMA